MLGTVWVGQGVGIIKGSFMTGSVTWLVIGVGVDLVATALLLAPRLISRNKGDQEEVSKRG